MDSSGNQPRLEDRPLILVVPSELNLQRAFLEECKWFVNELSAPSYQWENLPNGDLGTRLTSHLPKWEAPPTGITSGEIGCIDLNNEFWFWKCWRCSACGSKTLGSIFLAGNDFRWKMVSFHVSLGKITPSPIAKTPINKV